MLYNLNLKLWYPVETINDYNVLNKNKELKKKLKKSKIKGIVILIIY